MAIALIAAAAITVVAGAANDSDPLPGDWKTEDGTTSAIARRGSSSCITGRAEKYAG